MKICANIILGLAALCMLAAMACAALGVLGLLGVVADVGPQENQRIGLQLLQFAAIPGAISALLLGVGLLMHRTRRRRAGVDSRSAD